MEVRPSLITQPIQEVKVCVKIPNFFKVSFKKISKDKVEGKRFGTWQVENGIAVNLAWKGNTHTGYPKRINERKFWPVAREVQKEGDNEQSTEEVQEVTKKYPDLFNYDNSP